ncbi:MAG: hypothetical protein LBU80_04695 [Rikenellaceae bacterium]|jgi:hypothetical protein|nr:hypothetical protein [Rikenellaceae bacterium]
MTRRIFSLLLFLLVLPAWVCAQSGGVSVPFRPQVAERHPGVFSLSEGVRLTGDPRLTVLLSDGMEVRGIDLSPAARTKKSVEIEIEIVCELSELPVAGRGQKNAYAISVTQRSAAIRATSLRAAVLACDAFNELYNNPVAEKSGRRDRGIVLPCCKMVGWETSSAAMSVFPARYQGSGDILAHIHDCIREGIGTIGLPMVTFEGWLTEGRVMSLINPGQKIHAGNCYGYSELNMLRDKLAEYGIELRPSFDLVVRNEFFEQATGHAMLSLEGMRFVYVLLEEFFNFTAFDTIHVALPDKMRNAFIERLAEECPEHKILF